MKKMVLFSFVALSLNLALNLTAEEIVAVQDTTIANNGCDVTPPPPKPTCPPPPSCSKPCPPPKPVCHNTLCSAAPLSSNGWYVFGDLLYWHADVDHADWAYKNSDTLDPVITGPNHSLNFKWAYGFRVGLGANMDYDQWDTNVYYTWFQTENSNALGTKGTQSAADLFGLATPFTQGKMSWRIHYSVIDWELGRWFYVSKHLALRPHIGLKNAWISHHTHQRFTQVDNRFNTRSHNEFWGVGPSGGLNTAWNFANLGRHHFDFFGDFAGALMYGHFNVRHKEINTVIGTEIVLGPDTVTSGFQPSHLSRNLMVPMVQGIFGLSWDTGFNCDRCHFGIRVGYEFQYWWRQNQMLIGETAVGSTVRYHRSNGDLALQGLTIDFKFDF